MAGNPDWIARTSRYLSVTRESLSISQDYHAAIASFREAFNLLSTLEPESADVGAMLNEIVLVERALGDFAAAEHDYQIALQIAEKVGDREGTAASVSNLAVLAASRKDWPVVEQLNETRLGNGGERSTAGNYRRQLQISCFALARQNRKAEGMPYAQRAVAIYTQLRSKGLAAAQATLKECEEEQKT